MQEKTDTPLPSPVQAAGSGKSTLSRRAMVAMCAFTLFLILGVCTVSALLYTKVKVDDCTDTAYAYAHAVASFIDSDRITGYLETRQADEYYDSINKYLSSLLNASRLDYLYVLVPSKEGLTYIWDPQRNPSAKATPIGLMIPYPKGHGYDDVLSIVGQQWEGLLFSTDEDAGRLVSAAVPIMGRNGELVAVAFATVTVDSIGRELLGFLGGIALAITILVTILTFILYRHIRKRIIAPLGILSRGTQRMVYSIGKGERLELGIHTGDEIEDLAHSFEGMHRELNDYLKALATATAEKQRIATELSVATSIQVSMLPKPGPEFASRTDFRIHAAMSPAKEVGGDFYDAFLIDPSHLCMVVADVSGKGVPAALFMVISKTIIKLRAQLGGTLSTAQILGTANQQLIESNDAGMFVTAWVAIVDLGSGAGQASNAGHEHPVICRRGGNFELVEYQHSP
nr:SpoIIE family protein phosphatase [Succinivibrionaceae bacterium]